MAADETIDELHQQERERSVYIDVVTATTKVATVISVCGRLDFAELYEVKRVPGGGQMLTFRMSVQDADEWRAEEVLKVRLERIDGVLSVKVER